MAWKTRTFGTSHDCGGPAFGRLALEGECKRCDELRGGAAPRQGWGHQAKALEESRIRAIWAHDCRKAGCGPVCTAFDW